MLVAIFNDFRKKASRAKEAAQVVVNVYVEHLTSSAGSGVTPWLFAHRNNLSIPPPLT